MTANEAKEKTLYFWKYLAEHPEIYVKQGLPEEMWNELRQYRNACPLCEYLTQDLEEYDCRNCILGSCSTTSLYCNWFSSYTIEKRQKAAQAIVDKVMSWEV
jgi:hypothetical protein